MRTFAMPLAASLAFLTAGCGDARPVSPVAVIIPADLTGTWNDPDQAHPGFVAIGQRSLTIALQGAPRRSAAPESCSAEAGVGAGEIRLADGTRLFIATGSEPRERRMGDLRLIETARWLDLGIEAPGQPPLQRRLWASQNGQAAMAVMQAAPTLVATPPPMDRDARLTTAAGERRADALALVELRSKGADGGALAASFGERQAEAWRQVMAELVAAQGEPSAAAAHLAAADRMQRDADSFRAAVRSWLADRD